MGLHDVILFGRGNVYQRKKKKIFEDYNVICFLDNHVEDKEVDSETEIPVYNPKYIGDFSNEEVVILSYAVGSMAKQLLKSGVSSERIIMGPQMAPYNTFEEMLFSQGNGKLILDGDNVIYANKLYGIEEKTDDDNLERLVDVLKNTDMYHSSKDFLDNLQLTPIDDTYGFNRGTPVDRYYIEQFLDSNRNYIKGHVLEVGDRSYTEKYSDGDVERSIVLNVLSAGDSDDTIKGNLETGEGIPDGTIDCFICTQTLQFIYDVEKVVDNIIKVLKKGGVALVTVGGISQIIDYERRKFGHFWNFTDMSLSKAFQAHPEVESVETKVYGNVKSATAFLYGLSYDELKKEELDYLDDRYQVIIAAVIRKR